MNAKSNIRKRGLLDRIDRWLCIYVRPLELRYFWQKLWIRDDEFHPSLDQDVEIMFWISFRHRHNWLEQRDVNEAYQADLLRRRTIAHNRTLDQVPVSA